MNTLHYKEILDQAIREDIGAQDLTTDAIFPSNQLAKGVFTAKADGVLAGSEAIEIGFGILSRDVKVTHHKWDGHPVNTGDAIATVEAPIHCLLTGERVVLNLLQHLSGIATSTREAISNLNDPSITITDTRKTLPGLRYLQKYAVRCGGGRNHRFRLDDGVMIKDNHIKAAGSIAQAVELARANIGHMVKIEVETESREQVLEAIESKADVIMLDNRSPEEVKEFVELIPDNITVEVSGGINPDSIATYKNCGADVISLGWLTHSVTAMDISFNLVK
ncbi:carboxylating nicotinate-nucleotide diphosphorylase [Balneola sp. MJW-20]|uniref:carboxylating nicotinate-nucleotide diphosphorylase n=1 Tax=Gracilimonas aurantiaca TaxID=3234185 RepID=UPI0034660E72